MAGFINEEARKRYERHVGNEKLAERFFLWSLIALSVVMAAGAVVGLIVSIK